MMQGRARVAAVQVPTVLGDVDANLTACEKLAAEAGEQGAEWIALPEFFTTGMGFDPRLSDLALPPDGRATDLLQRLAVRHGANVGGSFLCRDDDGHVRNAYFLATPDGIAGRHDKDIPTMWENCFYIGSDDDGILDVDGTKVGAVLCLEFNRHRTVRRLREQVDLVMGGSLIWGIPGFLAAPPFQKRHARFTDWASRFARLVGAPVVEAGHVGVLRCKMPPLPVVDYVGRVGRSAVICDAEGNVVAERRRSDGPGIVVADVEVGRRRPPDEAADSFWIEGLDPLSRFAWTVQGWHGRRYYKNRRVSKATA